MGKHSSKPYNPNLASAFCLAGFIESWGRGIEKMCDALREDGIPVLSYTVHPGDIMVKFTAPEDCVVRVTEKVTDKVTEKVTDRLGARHVRLLTLLAEDPGYTTTQLADKMGVTRKAVSEYLKALRKMRIIERVESDRKDYWKILSD